MWSLLIWTHPCILRTPAFCRHLFYVDTFHFYEGCPHKTVSTIHSSLPPTSLLLLLLFARGFVHVEPLSGLRDLGIALPVSILDVLFRRLHAGQLVVLVEW